MIGEHLTTVTILNPWPNTCSFIVNKSKTICRAHHSVQVPIPPGYVDKVYTHLSKHLMALSFREHYIHLAYQWLKLQGLLFQTIKFPLYLIICFDLQKWSSLCHIIHHLFTPFYRKTPRAIWPDSFQFFFFALHSIRFCPHHFTNPYFCQGESCPECR